MTTRRGGVEERAQVTSQGPQEADMEPKLASGGLRKRNSVREGRNGGQGRGRSKAEEILGERKWLMILGRADSEKF